MKHFSGLIYQKNQTEMTEKIIIKKEFDNLNNTDDEIDKYH